MKKANFKTIIGLEVHVELKTRSKMFCGCSADYFGHKPNTHCCPICLGLPGALPVPNKTAIEWSVMIGLALNCKIQLVSKFDRKNYFYPDLPKGYQISQYDQPFCINGFLEMRANSKVRKIGIRRVHLEEDTGKLIHANIDGKDSSLIDFNRSGVPLVEIVTEPDLQSAEEAKLFLQKLQQIIRYLNISNADMEKGDMRLEPNISVQKPDEKGIPEYKVEVKNINSFRFAEKAINYEIKRQIEILKKREIPIQETRGWDENKQKTVSQRIKEEASDYRYFSEPDIPPVHWTEYQISNIKSQIKELPDQKLERFIKNYSLPYYDSEILTRQKPLADYFEEAVRVGKPHNVAPKQIANWIINKKINIEESLPAHLIQTILSSIQVSTINEEELEKMIDQVLKDNPKAVEDYKKGKENVMMFLVGQVLSKIKSKVDINLVRNTVIDKLK